MAESDVDGGLVCTIIGKSYSSDSVLREILGCLRNEFNVLSHLISHSELANQDMLVLEVCVSQSIDSKTFILLNSKLHDMSKSLGIDVIVQRENVFRRHKRLAIFDMDSTLIQQEVIDEIAWHAGVLDKVAKITNRAMNGELNFTESLRERVSLLKGLPVEVIDAVRESITFTPGARDLCFILKKLGYKLAVISGGFLPLANFVKEELGLDYAFANRLKLSQDGKTLSGEVDGVIVDGSKKAELLQLISDIERVDFDQVLAVGDGANDLEMLSLASLGIAFNAKPHVQAKARARINQNSLVHILFLLGFKEREINELLN